jgi:phosphate transport system substrate-binding protein
MFSVDALAIITNHLVGVDSLSMQHVSDLFSGKIKNWKELGGSDVSVKLYGRNKSSGTYDYFIDKFLALKPKGNIVECETNREILDAVINNEGAVGYVGVGFLHDESGKPNGKIWAAPIYIDSQQAVSPYQSLKVKKGEYVLTRPLYQYVNGVPNELIQDFILFELTKQGQDIVMSHGFFPINDYQTQINRLKGLIH